MYGAGHTPLSLGLILALCSGITPFGAQAILFGARNKPRLTIFNASTSFTIQSLWPTLLLSIGRILIFSKILYRVNFIANNIKRLLRLNIPSFPYVFIILSMIPSLKFILTFRHTTNPFKKIPTQQRYI